MARHNTQNGQTCCDNHSTFKNMVHKGNNSPRYMIFSQIAGRRISALYVLCPTFCTLCLSSGPGCKTSLYQCQLVMPAMPCAAA